MSSIELHQFSKMKATSYLLLVTLGSSDNRPSHHREDCMLNLFIAHELEGGSQNSLNQLHIHSGEPVRQGKKKNKRKLDSFFFKETHHPSTPSALKISYKILKVLAKVELPLSFVARCLD